MKFEDVQRTSAVEGEWGLPNALPQASSPPLFLLVPAPEMS